MFGQSLLSAFGIACTTDTDQLFSIPTTSSLATYQFNNATTSIPSNTYPGTAYNLNAYVTGKFGNAASFNGSSSYIRLPANFLNSNAQTISAWINPSSVSGNGTIYSSYDYQTGPSKGTYFRVNSGGQIQLTVHDGDCATMYPANPSCTDVTQLVSPSAISTNTWTHVVAVVGGSGNPMTIYINGVNVISTATMRTVGYHSGKQPLIGATDYVVNGTSYPPESFFTGSIDQVRCFSSALPQAAVTVLYNETTTTAQSASIDYPSNNPNSIAYYKMSDATDQLGNFNGTATNVNFNTEGKFGFAAKFNGSSSLITLPDSSSIAQENNFSLSFWIKPNGFVTYGTVFTFYSDYRNYVEITTGGIIRCNITGTTLSSPSSSITDGVWQHVAITKSSTTGLVIYVNDSIVLNDATYTGNASDFRSSSYPNTIGAYNLTQSTGTASDFFPGSMDQLRIYNAVLSAADVSTLYKEVECEPAAINALANFNTVLYTGNGGTNPINTVGFAPDFTWTKSRNGVNRHQLFDSVRGATFAIESDTNFAESEEPTALTAFDSNGFSLGSSGNVNSSGINYVAWNWKAGGTAVSNTDGTITSSISANQEAGFSIVSYTGNNASSATIGHGLNSAPELIFTKARNFGAGWPSMVKTSSTSVYGLRLNESGANNAGNGLGFYNNTAPTDSVYTVGGSDEVNDGYNYISYAFHSIPGYSKIGSYNGTGASGNVQYLGFEPGFILVKRTDSSGGWFLIDNKRNTSNPRNTSLEAQGSYQDNTLSSVSFDFDANSLEVNGTNAQINTNGGKYIFLAIA